MADRELGGRRIDRGTQRADCPVRRGPDGVWQVHGYAAVHAVLRSTDTVQAGLGIETVAKLPASIRRPVLYRDGQEHREHRRQTARYFTPRRVDEQYRGIMVRIAEEQLAGLRAAGRAELGELSFQLAIGVAAAVIGLTESRPGIRRRLESFFPEKFGKPGLTSFSGLYWLIRHNVNWLRVYLGDVRPAVRAHRERGRDDLISHLLAEGCSAGEILGECLTFAAAGMITTREFVNVAAWHLFSNEALRERYRAADEPGRLAVLHEILRLEPVVGRLRRRTTAALSLPGAAGAVAAETGAAETGAAGTVTVPAGALVDLFVDSANVDPRVVGDRPERICPGRAMADHAGAAGLSFGDGAHKCPGASIAILETDVFLSRLFALPGLRMLTPPRISFKHDIGGYELRGLTVALDAGPGA
ncbi:cytochrome P450 [Goodfellowiella coeruleoviolacea]|uniref:Cytochrome P450 n=1 Tax=Goodfellowiella coeruleoviolacea TaxID=334858 RepID=A0AAE3G9M5_9PSEU|nr:cytochrome P450 [Goodfellowiella coeruleoviolacea]MCP2163434.1 Cytochrome P450 [Goodfellowiella coeruleoviolacea]